MSILPALLGTARAPIRESIVHHSIHGMFSIREGSWKLEFCPGSGGWAAPLDAAARQGGLPEIQLYDLSRDPAETKNIQAENPAARMFSTTRWPTDLGRADAPITATRRGARTRSRLRIVMESP